MTTRGPPTDEARVGLRTRVLYGAGSMANGAYLQIMGGLLLLYYNQVLGLPAQLASLALGISVLVDAFWDPLVGMFSDNLRTRWGRRHPLMYFSALPVAISFAFLFMPPHGLPPMQLFAYLLGMTLCVRMSLSLYEVPSGALAPELAPAYHDRTILLGYRWLLGTLGGAIAAVLAYAVFLHKTPKYPLGQLNPAGYPPLAITVAILMVVSIIVSSLGTHDRIPRLYRPAALRFDIIRAAKEVATTLKNWNFAVAVIAGVVAATASSLYAGLSIYFGTYFWRLPSANVLVLVLTGLVSTPIAVTLAPALSRRWGKRRACMTLFFLSVITANGPIVLRLLNLFPANGSPALMPLLIANSVIGGVLGTGGYIIVTSMIADIVEESQVKTGRRSEGLLFAGDALLNKVVSGFATVLPGLLLAYVGFPTHATLASLDPAVMTKLAWIYVPITTGLSSLSIFCWRFYRIDAATHERNLASIAESLATAETFAEVGAPSPSAAGSPAAAPGLEGRIL
jgi:GPH family glycoside/pentoside/hexuronide:cation symporter